MKKMVDIKLASIIIITFAVACFLSLAYTLNETNKYIRAYEYNLTVTVVPIPIPSGVDVCGTQPPKYEECLK